MTELAFGLGLFGTIVSTMLAIVRINESWQKAKLKKRALLRIVQKRVVGDRFCFVVRNDGEGSASDIRMSFLGKNEEWTVAKNNCQLEGRLEGFHQTTIEVDDKASKLRNRIKVEWKNEDGTKGSLDTLVGRSE